MRASAKDHATRIRLGRDFGVMWWKAKYIMDIKIEGLSCYFGFIVIIYINLTNVMFRWGWMSHMICERFCIINKRFIVYFE